MIFKLRDEQNMTIIISSHILEELSKIATHYGIIHNGTLVQEITKEELMQRCGERMEIFSMTQNRRCRCWIRWDLRTIR